MALKQIIVALGLSIWISQAHAQSFTIKVLQKGTGNPVEGATVVIRQTQDYDTTNKKGELSFDDVTLPFDIRVLETSHETLEQQVNTDRLTVYIEPLSFEGASLEVVEERVKEKTSKIVLQQEELRRVPGTQGDPIKMIESLPGVVVNSGGDGGAERNAIYVRGSSGSENSFWINRLPVNNLFHVWGISVVNPSLVKDFNIFLGGFPVEYNDVLGGVVDIQLRNPKTDRLHQTYRIALNESAALVEGPINKQQSFYAAGRISYIDKVLDPFIDDIVEALDDPDSESEISFVTLPKYWDVQGNWHYELPKGSADVYYFGSGDAFAINIKKLDTPDPDLIGNLSFETGFHTLGLDTKRRLTPQLTAHVTGSVKQSYIRQTIGKDENGEPFKVDLNITDSLLHPQLLWAPLKHHEFTLGAQATYNIVPVKVNINSLPTEENFSGQNFSSQTKIKVDDEVRGASASPYLKWRWSKDKWNTVLGARYTKVRATGGVDMEGYSPRATVEYQATERLLLSSSWGHYIQAPTNGQQLRNYGNPQLGFTKAEHRIIGMQYKFTPIWNMQLEAYQKPMQKLVLTRPLQSPPDNYRNDGEGEAYGIDLLLKREYAERKMGWLSYSYARSSRTLIGGGERDFSGDQPHTLTAVWSQPFLGSWNKWTWGFKLQANSGQPFTPVVGRVAMCNDGNACPNQEDPDVDGNLSYWNPIYGERNSLRHAFAHQLDLRIDRLIRYDTWTLTAYLDLINVTFQQSAVSFDYGKNYEDYRHPRKGGMPGFPLPFLGIEANF